MSFPVIVQKIFFNRTHNDLTYQSYLGVCSRANSQPFMSKPRTTNISTKHRLSMNNYMYLHIPFLDFGQQDPVPNVLLPQRERGEASDNP